VRVTSCRRRLLRRLLHDPTLWAYRWMYEKLRCRNIDRDTCRYLLTQCTHNYRPFAIPFVCAGAPMLPGMSHYDDRVESNSLIDPTNE
jgi:hypothetical protein